MVLRPRHGLSLCAGGGGLDMGLMLAEPGFHTRCYVEWEEYPRSVLISAQRAGYFVPAPIWDDLTTFDGRPFRGAIDTILAGYPCQPFSQAGQRRGHDDERHLWPEVARVIRDVEPRWIFLENVSGHVTLGLETVLRELWDMGWTPAAGLFSASETGAPHERLRVFIVAYRDNDADARGVVGGQTVCRAAEGEIHGEERERFRSGTRRSGINVDHSTGSRSAQARIGADERSDGDKRRKPVSGDRCGKVADTSVCAGHEGRSGVQRGCDTETRAGEATSLVRCGHYLFPPGPGDGAAWATVIGMAPGLAPAVAFGDIARRAQELVAMASAGELAQAAAESDLRRVVDGLASRSRALRLLGNGVFSLAAAHAWRTLASFHGLRPVDLDADGCSPETDTGELLVSAAVRGELK